MNFDRTNSGSMQATLVSHYGIKAKPFSGIIQHCQNMLSELLPDAFRPYELEQVHGTIVGLEGYRKGQGIINAHFKALRQEERNIRWLELLNFLRSERFPDFKVRIGGFRHERDYGFLSQHSHPYLRSFSIRNNIAVAMGWPIDGSGFPDILDQLRRRFNEFNVLHRWHRTPDEIDNDLYFVLGRVDSSQLNHSSIVAVEHRMRLFLSEQSEMIIPINNSVLSIVRYLDTQLPRQTSCSLSISDSSLDESMLMTLYPDYDVL